MIERSKCMWMTILIIKSYTKNMNLNWLQWHLWSGIKMKIKNVHNSQSQNMVEMALRCQHCAYRFLKNSGGWPPVEPPIATKLRRACNRHRLLHTTPDEIFSLDRNWKTNMSHVGHRSMYWSTHGDWLLPRKRVVSGKCKLVYIREILAAGAFCHLRVSCVHCRQI